MTMPAQPLLDTAWLGLAGRVAAVTGAAGGIGAEIARALAAAGCRLALLDRDTAAVEALAISLNDAGHTTLGIGCDITDADSVSHAADRAGAELGPCRILVNNAAVLYADALMAIRVEKWNQLLAVNLTGALLCAQAFGRQMAGAGGGSMIHLGSISGSLPQPYGGAYSVSKAGLKMLSQLLTVELGGDGIRSNLVSPAMIRTPLSEPIYRDPAVLRRREEIAPLGRIGSIGDIAEAVLFLASDRSSYISGQDLVLDGGLAQAWLSLIPRPGFEKADAERS